MQFLTLAMAGYAVSELEIVRVRSFFELSMSVQKVLCRKLHARTPDCKKYLPWSRFH